MDSEGTKKNKDIRDLKIKDLKLYDVRQKVIEDYRES